MTRHRELAIFRPMQDFHDEEEPIFEEGYDEEGYVIRPNKSQLHRDALALLELGKKLSEMEPTRLKRLAMPDELFTALMDAKKIHQNGARKRHFKFIGKLLRDMETEALEQAVSEVAYGEAKSNAEFHQMERWRDRLLDSDDKDALTAFMGEYPQADAGRIRQLIRNAQKEIAQSKPPRSSRLLFQALREVMQA